MPTFLTAQDVRRAREHSTGHIYPLHRATLVQCPPCPQDHRCNQGRCDKWHDTISTDYGALGCAPEGGKHADPVPSATHKHAAGMFWTVYVAAFVGVAGWAVLSRWPLF